VQVDFEGIVLLLSGECPNITFLASGQAVVTNGQTEFRKGRCRDLSLGDFVRVRGTTTAGNPVLAERVEFRGINDDIEATGR
jgi:hypothetical protein